MFSNAAQLEVAPPLVVVYNRPQISSETSDTPRNSTTSSSTIQTTSSGRSTTIIRQQSLQDSHLLSHQHQQENIDSRKFGRTKASSICTSGGGLSISSARRSHLVSRGAEFIAVRNNNTSTTTASIGVNNSCDQTPKTTSSKKTGSPSQQKTK